MPLKPNFLERQLIGAGIVSGLLLDLGMSMMQTWALIAAGEARIFEELEQRDLDLETLASSTKCSLEGIKVLVETLVGLGYLKVRKGRYGLTKAARRSLPIDDLRQMMPFFKDQILVNLDAFRAVRDAPKGGIVTWERMTSGEVGHAYQVTMRWLASGLVDEVTSKVSPPSGGQRMLDVGGGHGLYTVAFCRKHPGLRGTVLDWPIGIEAAKETLRTATDVADRIDLVERDFEREELPEGYDFAFLGNIIHGFSPEGNRELFSKLARATTGIGMVVILEQLSGASGSAFARGVVSLIGLSLFLFSGGRSYPYEDLSRWLSDAGFSRISRKGLRKSPGYSLVIAQKEG